MQLNALLITKLALDTSSGITIFSSYASLDLYFPQIFKVCSA